VCAIRHFVRATPRIIFIRLAISATHSQLLPIKANNEWKWQHRNRNEPEGTQGPFPRQVSEHVEDEDGHNAGADEAEASHSGQGRKCASGWVGIEYV
jgi:hypothetical protein